MFRDKEKALSVLEQLHIIALKQDENRRTYYELSKGFRRSLRYALEGSGTHASFGVPSSQPDPKKVSIAFLDDYARQQWENLLFYMVGSTVGLTGSGQSQDIGEGTKALLKAGELIKTVNGRVSITRAGFTFVLQETNAQVWSLLIVYLRNAPQVNQLSTSRTVQRDSDSNDQLGMSETDVLSFLFMLGSLELGQDYTTATLSPTQQTMLDDLSAFGIVYRSSKSSTNFYPTRLAVTLTSDSGALSNASQEISTSLAPSSGRGGNAAKQGFIIIETNYRLYAYTSSLLQIAVLSLFTKLTTRFPNLVSGKLTKESITRAVKLGISSSQILSYLTAHAHPQMQKNNPYLPPTVMDQIRLWEYEGERVETTSGYLMKEFRGPNEYEDLVSYAQSLGVLVWKNDSKRLVFVDRIEQITSFLQRKNRG